MRLPPNKLDALHANLDEIERDLTGRERTVPVIVIEGGLPAEEQRPCCTVRYGQHVWHRVADEGETWEAFLARVGHEAEARGGVIIVIGGLPAEPRDDDTDPTWCKVE